MAYVSSNAPIPGTSGPSACAIKRSNTRIARARAFTDAGRQRVYDLTPTLDSFAAISPTLAGNAAQILEQTDVSRQSVMYGAASPDNLPQSSQAPISSVAPTVVPLSGTPQQVMGCSHPMRLRAVQDLSSTPAPKAVVMPEPAPAFTQFAPSFFSAPQPLEQRGGAPVSLPGLPIGRYMSIGMSGFSPPWGDVEAQPSNGPGGNGGTGDGGPSWKTGLLVVGGFILLAAFGSKRGRR
jgi:hypothetical protein